MTSPSNISFVSALPIAAFVLNARGQLLECNEKAQTLLGIPIFGQSYLSTIRQPKVVATLEACLRTNQPVEGTFERVGPQGDQRFKVAAAPFTADGEPRVLVSFDDISPIYSAGQMRRDFVANVSHELRTPLTAVIGFIETLQGPARNDPKVQDRFLDMMLRESVRMDRLVGDLLTLSRVEAAERERPKSAVNLCTILEAACDTIRVQAEKDGITLDIKASCQEASIWGDEDQLRQIFNNLIENAIKYGAAGGRVVLSVKGPTRDPLLRSDVFCVEVEDFGAGIAAHHLPRLTERFYRVDDHRSREMGGTGLGLAIVKHILSRHRGRMEIKSNPGHGTCVAIFIPTV